ncbi:hypothetical protein AAU57_07835 [Nonlabens sp. YIK11]|uniref:DUF6913 domain-containing protein n=1 Tax=Nonlabens sp. YIK11 TaxID=1453349 RepID=UPI0007080075|nr:hypothetical protein [Nonlabens sp. YIK11]KQC33235.1 hypothetical protein AAU57_07835 [Nonlabens sp. YIK11]
MIFDVLKRRWLRKQQEKLSGQRRSSITSKPLSMVVLYDADAEKSTLFMEQWSRELGIQDYQMVGVTVDTKKQPVQDQLLVSMKSIQWAGGLADPALKELLDRHFDLQINLFEKRDDLKSYVAMALHSGITAGLASLPEDHYDLAIDVKPSQKELFIKELNKYLNIITK